VSNYPQPLEKRLMQTIRQLEQRVKRLEHIAADPVAIGSQLARTTIQSPNYLQGAAGWSLNADGTGEFTGMVTAGLRITIGTVAPSGANVGDLWYDGNNNFLLTQWNGTDWIPYQFGTNAIMAGSVTANLVAANAIVAGMIAAGAIDGFTINGAQINGQQINATDIIISGTNGGLFTYGSGGTTVETHSGSGSSPVTGTWIAPNNVTTVTVELWGGAGGGGGNGGANFFISGAAGGGGQYVKYQLTVVPGNSYSWSIGGHGNGGSGAGVDGGDGGVTWFSSSTTAKADGGNHGQSGNTGAAGGSGGTATPPGSPIDVQNGGRGGNGIANGPAGGGGGGGSGGPGVPGNAGNPGRNSGSTGGSGYGAGASAVPGGGPGGRGRGANLSPFAGQSPAVGPAGGGGGGGGDGGGSRAGANGWSGKMVLTYTPSSTSIMASIAGAPGTDPLSAEAFPAGIMTDGINAPIVAVDPINGGPESWHPITLDSGWITVASNTVPQYKLMPDKTVMIEGYCSHAAFSAALNLNGSTPLPTPYRPATNYHQAAYTDVSGQAIGVRVTPAGVISVEQVGGSSTILKFSIRYDPSI